jgi:MFS family permease
VLGGYVTGHFGWRFVFLMPVPIGLAATLLCLWGMREGPKNASGERMDWRGGLVYATGVCLFICSARPMPRKCPSDRPCCSAGCSGWRCSSASSPGPKVRSSTCRF